MKAKAILETILYGEDIPALRRFYEDVIGLEVRRELEGQFVFFHCGESMLLVFNPLTARTKLIADTINMKSRKTYSGMLIGFVNINANKAKCSLVTASRT